MIAGVLLSAWNASQWYAAQRFQRGLADPAGAQFRLLRRFVRHDADTWFGRAHDLGTCTSPEQFRQRVPLQTWQDHAPAVERIRAGEPRVLTRERVQRLIPTSGTGSARKLIPWTNELQRGFADALAPWICDLFRRCPTARGGPGYWSITPPAEAPLAAGAVPVGFDHDSAYLGGLWQGLVGATMAVPDRVVQAPDVIRATALHLLRCRDLRLISVWHPSFLELLFDRMDRDRESLTRCIAEGEPSIGLPPDRTRARELAGSDWSSLSSRWPRLAVVSAWADGPAAMAARSLGRRLGAVPFQGKGLLATEGAVTIPVGRWRPLAITSHLFEFIDVHGRCRWAHELGVGETYEVVMTTGAGLWRYRLGDRVEVDGLVGRTPSLRFRGRCGSVADLAGEKLDEALVAEVIAGLPLRGAGFAALQPEPKARRWRLVVDRHAQWSGDLAKDLDASLHRIHHWRVARILGQLQPPVVFRADLDGPGLLRRIAAHRRQRLGECKPPVLLPEDLDW